MLTDPDTLLYPQTDERERTIESPRDQGASTQRADNHEAVDSADLEDLEGDIPDDLSQDLMLEACFKDEEDVRIEGPKQMGAKRDPTVPGVPTYFLRAKRSTERRRRSRSRRSRSRSRQRQSEVLLLSYE